MEVRVFRTAPADANKLRSLELIVDFAACIRQLVENSIDAGATDIAVKVDISKFYISVSDNGRGISAIGIKNLGSERYMSSKTYTPGCYGFRGVLTPHSLLIFVVVDNVNILSFGR
jgi:DNA mismatch repair ATPase MutL